MRAPKPLSHSVVSGCCLLAFLHAFALLCRLADGDAYGYACLLACSLFCSLSGRVLLACQPVAGSVVYNTLPHPEGPKGQRTESLLRLDNIGHRSGNPFLAVPSTPTSTFKVQYLLYVKGTLRDGPEGLGTTSGKHWSAPPRHANTCSQRCFRLLVVCGVAVPRMPHSSGVRK